MRYSYELVENIKSGASRSLAGAGCGILSQVKWRGQIEA